MIHRTEKLEFRMKYLGLIAILFVVAAVGGCKSPTEHRREADRVAYDIITQKQEQALGRAEPFTIERPSQTLRRQLLLGQNLPRATPVSLGTRDIEPIEQWPDESYLKPAGDQPGPTVPWESEEPLHLSLVETLQVGARNSRDYQTQKEGVFQTALRLDLERDAFRNTWTGLLESLTSADLPGADVVGVENTASVDLDRRFENGVTFAAGLMVDLVKLLTMDGASSLGLLADASISVPLLRGSGRFVVTEPLTQADRDAVYAIYEFERFKRTFAVRIASDYLEVLQQLDQVRNAEKNYKRLIASTRRARRLADAGRLPEIQVDQATQDELRARDRWVSARQSYMRRLDGFKTLLGLPTDASIELDRQELGRLSAVAGGTLGHEQPAPRDQFAGNAADAPVELTPPDRTHAGPLELDERHAIELALAHRLDLKVAVGRVFDAQRTAAVAADMLRADLTLLGSGAFGERRTLASAGVADADLRPEEGTYFVGATLDLPLERTAERNLYRNSLVSLERAARDVQDLEDQVKLEVRNQLRDLLEFRERLQIQSRSVSVAERRVASTDLFLQAGRTEIRDVLEAQEALISAQNALTSARVGYRVAELELQRDLGLLDVNEKGIWREYDPHGDGHDDQ